MNKLWERADAHLLSVKAANFVSLFANTDNSLFNVFQGQVRDIGPGATGRQMSQFTAACPLPSLLDDTTSQLI